MTIDSLMDREYDREKFHCLHFSSEAWELITGDASLTAVREADLQSLAMRAVFRQYRRVAGPTDTPSLVLMENLSGEQHMGVCLHHRLLHLVHTGPQFLPFDAITPLYRNLRFYQ